MNGKVRNSMDRLISKPKHLYCKNCNEEMVYCHCCGRELTLTDKRKHQCNACKEKFNLCPSCGEENWKWE